MQIPNPFPVSELTLCRFVAFLARAGFAPSGPSTISGENVPGGSVSYPGYTWLTGTLPGIQTSTSTAGSTWDAEDPGQVRVHTSGHPPSNHSPDPAAVAPGVVGGVWWRDQG